MAQRGYSQETILQMLREIENDRSSGLRVHQACRKVGITDTTYYKWRAEHKVAV